MSKLKLRTKILLVPLWATLALLVILALTFQARQRSEQLVEEVELTRDLEEKFVELGRQLQDASSAFDEDMLDDAAEGTRSSRSWRAASACRARSPRPRKTRRRRHRRRRRRESQISRGQEATPRAARATPDHTRYGGRLRPIEAEVDSYFRRAEANVRTELELGIKPTNEEHTRQVAQQNEIAVALGELSREAREAMEESFRSTLNRIILLSLLFIVVLFALSFWLVRSITQPLGGRWRSASRWPAGDLGTHVEAPAGRRRDRQLMTANGRMLGLPARDGRGRRQHGGRRPDGRGGAASEATLSATR